MIYTSSFLYYSFYIPYFYITTFIQLIIKVFFYQQVKIFNLLEEELTDADVLVMGTDGLWDVTTNEKAADVVQKSLDHFPANDAQRYKYR